MTTLEERVASMPKLISSRLAATCALAVVILLFASALAGAKGGGISAQLRVLTTSGKVLAEKTLRTGTTSIPTSPRATCFGEGSGGSGKPVTVKGATALGLLAQAAKSVAALRPLLVTDHFSFGLGLCGVGGDVVKGEGPSWYLTVNHVNPEVGGEEAKLHPGDEVVWYLAASYPYPKELALIAPASVQAGKPFGVRVFSYNEKGKRRPAAGVRVTGASGPSDSGGHAAVTLSKPALLIARRAGVIPSSREPVCVGGRCPGGGS
jgi:hypothetical protein